MTFVLPVLEFDMVEPISLIFFSPVVCLEDFHEEKDACLILLSELHPGVFCPSQKRMALCFLINFFFFLSFSLSLVFVAVYGLSLVVAVRCYSLVVV